MLFHNRLSVRSRSKRPCCRNSARSRATVSSA